MAGTTRTQGYRDVIMNTLPFRGIAINDASDNIATVQVYASDSGILFIQEYADPVAYTLPAVADCKGKWFMFFDNTGQAITIAGTADSMSGGYSGATVDNDQVISGGTQGEWCIIIGDGSSYFCLTGEGTWAGS